MEKTGLFVLALTLYLGERGRALLFERGKSPFFTSAKLTMAFSYFKENSVPHRRSANQTSYITSFSRLLFKFV